MPHPIVYNGTQDDDRTRSIDVVHIEPSIREGVHLVSSLYGSEASAPLYRFPPSNTVAPWISGDTQIPSVLTCNEGQWPASPTAQYAYQWMSNGADIPGQTNRTYMTDASVDSTTITCEVRGFNPFGEDYALTPGVDVSLIEPIEVRDVDLHFISGLESPKHMITNQHELTISSGTSAEDRMDIVRSDVYYATGTAADDRNDIVSQTIPVITGLRAKEIISILGHEGIAIISDENGSELLDGIPQPLPLKNGQAHYGFLGWDVFGAVDLDQTHVHFGEYSFFGGKDVDVAQANIPYSYMWQDVPIWPVWESEIDLGSCSVHINWQQRSIAWEDQGNCFVEFLDSGGSLISGIAGPGLLSTRDDSWTYRYFDTPIPVNTRFIRVYAEFSLQAGEDNNAYIDTIQGEVYKGTKINDRSYGPTFEQWRIKFLQANTYSGSALSELEMRSNIGGADLCTGGTILKGSEGIGGLASYAFDDLRNTGYWAGALNSITEGTSWLGYDFGSLEKPAEIDITARTGTSAKQVGSQFMLQGRSDDADHWTDVQLFNNYSEFNSGQQKQFVVAVGAKPYLIKDLQDPLGNERDDTNLARVKVGHIWQAKTRLTITHLRAMFTTTGTDTQLFIHKTNFNSPEGILFDMNQAQVVVGPTTSGNAELVEVALTSDFIVEVGEYFTIGAQDLNQVDGIARVRYYDNPIADGVQYNDYVDWVMSYGSSEENLYEGQQNASTLANLFEVDFRGTIF